MTNPGPRGRGRWVAGSDRISFAGRAAHGHADDVGTERYHSYGPAFLILYLILQACKLRSWQRAETQLVTALDLPPCNNLKPSSSRPLTHLVTTLNLPYGSPKIRHRSIRVQNWASYTLSYSAITCQQL